MKWIVKVIFMVMWCSAAVALPVSGPSKIGTIDLRKVFDNYWKRQQAELALKERSAEYDKELKGFVDEYKKAQEDYNKLLTAANDQSVTPEERDKRKAAAEAKVLEIKTSENTIKSFGQDAREKLDSQMKRMRESILQDIRAAINAKAQAAGYALVIDSAAESLNQTPTVLYNNGENDMTDVILKQLNAAAPTSVTGETNNVVPMAKPGANK